MRLIFIIIACLLFFSCSKTPPDTITGDEIDSFFKKYNEYAHFRKEVIAFYEKRNGSYIWFNGSLNDHGKNFLKRLNKDTVETKNLYREASAVIESIPAKRKKMHDSIAGSADLMLTVAFFDFAENNWIGFSPSEIRRSGWLIKPRNVDPALLLDSALSLNAGKMEQFDPVYSQHGKLKEVLKQYKKFSEKDWKNIPVVRPLKPGDNDALIPAIKNNLFLMQDMKRADSSMLYDEELKNGILSFQKRHGLVEDGIINEETADLLEVPIDDIVNSIMVNIERCRWFPEHLYDDNIVVNVPAYELQVINNDELQWKCNVVVGSDSTHTLIFYDFMETIVFSPHWNIPQSIIYKETIPAVQNDDNYLESHNMEVVDKEGNIVDADKINWNKEGDFEYIIRQKPGSNNALGKVKFLLPNAHNIYLHDTPAKSLFSETDRAFSHGCIRVSEPLKLAKYLLRDEKEWNEKKIIDAMNSGKEQFVKLSRKVPVFITYFTCWVDEGKLNSRKDIYGLDRKTSRLL